MSYVSGPQPGALGSPRIRNKIFQGDGLYVLGWTFFCVWFWPSRCFLFPCTSSCQPGGSRLTRNPKQDFRGCKMWYSRLRIYMSFDVPFFKGNEIYESLQVLLLKRTLSSLIIPADFFNSNVWIAEFVHSYFCFTLRLPRWRWPVMQL